LDYADARSFAVREQEDSLLLEAQTGESERPLTVTLSLADLVEIVAWSTQGDALPTDTATSHPSGSALKALLDRSQQRDEASPRARSESRELVGASR
jgi:hypothetical protein